jgi:hypothetical protein
MVMQEPEVIEEALEFEEHSRPIAWACWAFGAPIGLHRAYLGRFSAEPLLGAAGAAGFLAGGLLAGTSLPPKLRRALVGAGALIALATWLRELIVLRQLLNRPEAEAQSELADQRISLERGAADD